MKKLIAILLCTPLMAHAAFLDGNKLLRYLSSTSDIEKFHAMGYVLGVHDTMESSLCLSRNVTAQQASDVVRKFLVENPASRDLNADILVIVALTNAFPCPQQQKGKRS